MYAKNIEGAVTEYTDRQLKADNPNVSFPGVLDDTIRADFGMHSVALDAKPAFNPVTEVCTRGIITGEPGEYVQGWVVFDKYDNEQDKADAVAANLAILKAAKQAEIDDDFAAAAAQIKAGYPADEVISWDRQIVQAERYTADSNASVPLLEQMIITRNKGETVADLAIKILSNAAAYEIPYGQILGERQARTETLGAIDLQAVDAEQQIAEV